MSTKIFGEPPTTGEEIERLLALYDGTVEPLDAPSEPDNAKNFYTLARNGYIPETRDVLLRKLILALTSSRKLTRGDLRTELEYVRATHTRLSRPNGFVGGDECVTALEKREASLLSDETIDRILGARIDVTKRFLWRFRCARMRSVREGGLSLELCYLGYQPAGFLARCYGQRANRGETRLPQQALQ